MCIHNRQLLPSQCRDCSPSSWSSRAASPPIPHIRVATLSAAAGAPRIPRIVSFIWLGGPLPDKYATNIGGVAAAAAASGFRVRLWVEPRKAARNAARLLRYPTVQILSIDTLWQRISGTRLDSQLVRMLQRVVGAESIGATNLAAASDVLRLLILFLDGGYYFDTDVSMCGAPSALVRLDDSAHAGADFVLAAIDAEPPGTPAWSVFEYRDRKLAHPGCDCWAMGSIPAHPIIETALKHIAVNYDGALWRGDRWQFMNDKRFGEERANTGAYSSMHPLLNAIAADYRKRNGQFGPERIHNRRRMMDDSQLLPLDASRCTPERVALKMGICTRYDGTWRNPPQYPGSFSDSDL